VAPQPHSKCPRCFEQTRGCTRNLLLHCTTTRIFAPFAPLRGCPVVFYPEDPCVCSLTTQRIGFVRPSTKRFSSTTTTLLPEEQLFDFQSKVLVQMRDVEMGLLFITHHKTLPAAAASTRMPSAEVDWLSPGRPLLDGFG